MIRIDPAVSCTGKAQPGTVAFKEDILGAFPDARNGGIYNCRDVVGGDSLSIHSEGRAVDIMVTSRPLGDAVVEWLLNRTEKYQIQRIIFWRRIWDPKDGWHDYTGENPHTGHVHVEQNWCGAARKNCDTLQAGTSWIQWTLLAMMGGGLVYTWWKRRRYLRAQ